MKYFISYSHAEGFGRCDLQCRVISDGAHLRDLEKKIEEDGERDQVVILFYRAYGGDL